MLKRAQSISKISLTNEVIFFYVDHVNSEKSLCTSYQGQQNDLQIELKTPPPTLGRAYLLTLLQLRCIAIGENEGSHPLDVTNEMLSGTPGTFHGITTDQQGWYCVLLLCGSLYYKDIQVPVVTLRGWPEKSVPRNSPSLSYRNTIRKGLQQTYPDKLNSDVEEYLDSVI